MSVVDQTKEIEAYVNDVREALNDVVDDIWDSSRYEQTMETVSRARRQLAIVNEMIEKLYVENRIGNRVR